MLSEVNKFLRYAKVYKKYCHSEPSGERIQPIQNNLSCGNASLIPPYKLQLTNNSAVSVVNNQCLRNNNKPAIV